MRHTQRQHDMNIKNHSFPTPETHTLNSRDKVEGIPTSYACKLSKITWIGSGGL